MSYNRTHDGHGGRAHEHREEMRQIAAEVVKELTPQIAAEIYNEALTRLIGALQYDIDTVVSVSLNSAEEIFRDKKVKKIISDRIVQEMKSRIKDLIINI